MTLPFAYVDPTGGLPPSAWGPLLAALLAASAATATVARSCAGRMGRLLTSRRGLWGTIAVTTILAGSLMAFFDIFGPRATQAAARGRRVLVLAFDGLDPRLLDEYLAAGRLPNFARLRDRGVYRPLGTSDPPQSPVAWSTFITGAAACEHGVFDFVRRDPATYMADLATADRHGRTLPWTGTPIWELPAIRRLGFVAHRMPMTFPPPRLPRGRLLAGMGVWDVRGTEGTYAFYATDPPARAAPRGIVRKLEPAGGGFSAALAGPYRHGGADDLREPFRLEPAPDRRSATLTLQGRTYRLEPGRWSDWIDVEFRMGVLGTQRLRAVTRAWLELEPGISLYVSPLQFDPRAPFLAITSPRSWSVELAAAIGTFATRGMPFDTQAVNDGVLSDEAFLQQVEQVTAESERMLFHDLARLESGALFAYFQGSDVVQHMFWRGIDPEHPLHDDPETRRHADVIPRLYERCDAILGRATEALAGRGTVIVLSDHGFAPFRRAVHLNAVLRELGWLALLPGHDHSTDLFAAVDWSRTRAYAVGFNAVYLNLAGREAQGIVRAAEAGRVAAELAAALAAWTEPDGGGRPILRATQPPAVPGSPDLVVGYSRGWRASWETALGGVPAATGAANAAKWSGDHCIDAAEVPGVFLSSDPALDASSLADVAAAIDRHLAEDGP